MVLIKEIPGERIFFGPVFREEMVVIGPYKGLESAPLVSRNFLRKFIVCVPIYSPKRPPCVPIKSPKASTHAPLLAPRFCLVLRVLSPKLFRVYKVLGLAANILLG